MRFGLVFLLTVTCLATEIGGVKLPQTLSFAGHEVQLHGAGLRKKLFIKVYAGALYLSSEASTEQQILSEDSSMVVRMHFIYDGVSVEKLISAWDEGFSKTTAGEFGDKVKAFNALFRHEAKKGNIYDVVYIPGQGIEVFFNDQSQGKVTCGPAFKKAVFAIWLGPDPADEGLKEGMLKQ